MLEDKLDSDGQGQFESPNNALPQLTGQNLENRVKVTFRDIWRQMSWKDKFLIGASTAASALISGPLMTFSIGAVNMIVYKLLQKRIKQPMNRKGVLAEAIYGNIYTSWGVALYSVFHKLTSVASRLLFGFGFMFPVSLALYFPMKHLLHNYTFREFTKGVFTGSVWKDSYESLKANYPGAFKKIMLYGSLPLFLFWGYTPPSLLESQPLIHGTVGAVGRVALKYTVDKDIKTKLGTAVYGKPKESQAYALA
ncbi:hypothetical protein J4227_07830 [Candidatus Woesearchaeota archaeon]|nr:hypothetical protein [Candidatus Woesearchaeota archaeon]